MKNYAAVILFVIILLISNIILSTFVIKYNKVLRYKVDAIGVAIKLDNKAWELSSVQDKPAEMWCKDLDVLHEILSSIIFYYILSSYAVVIILCFLIFMTASRRKSLGSVIMKSLAKAPSLC